MARAQAPPEADRSPTAAVGRMQVPADLQVTLVACEPLVRQPVAIEFDDRGRLWVIQYLQYPNPAGLQRVNVDRYSRTQYDRIPEPPPHGPRGADRITILEDTNGDGHYDSGRDFVDGLNLASGLAFGYGGVFVLNVPYLLFYPDHDRDDVPDGDPEVLLSGFGMEDAHSVANSLTWGPDGWLYGCQGSTVTANIRGIEFQQGVWRYQPTTGRFELFCEGGGNSWGLDFDASGELFYSTNYGGHVLLHGVQGGYYVKSFAKHGPLHNRFAYGFFDHAPHRDFRGGHVTVGGIVYQADGLPGRFRDKYIAADLLGHNVYWHSIVADGSTFRTEHGGDLLVSHDSWFAPSDVTTGPDGAIYVADWHDARTAHPDPDAQWDRSNGRIYRIAPPHLPRPDLDLAGCSSEQLLALHDHANQWVVRRARQELVRREEHSLNAEFRRRCRMDPQWNRAVEALWSLHALAGLDPDLAAELLDSPHAAVRKWAVRLVGDQVAGGQLSLSEDFAHRLDRLAEEESAIEVRQQLACTAARLPAEQALPIINANIIRDIDQADSRLPLLWWWAIERHSLSGRPQVLSRFTRPSVWNSRLGREHLLPRLIRRYTAEATSAGLDSVLAILQSAPDQSARSECWPAVLAGWREQQADQIAAFRRQTATYHALSALIISAWQHEPRNIQLTQLAIALGHDEPLHAAGRLAFDERLEEAQRIEWLQVLAEAGAQTHLADAVGLLNSQASLRLQLAALGIVARDLSASNSQLLVALYRTTAAAELRARLLETLFSRADSARSFLEAVEAGEIEAASVPIEAARRLAALQDDSIDAMAVRHWGRLQAQSTEEKLAEIRRLNNDLRAAVGNSREGRAIFGKLCANCHRLFGEGTPLGPDLTTANRQDRDYLLSSLVDPSNFIRAEYLSLIVQTFDGRVLTGLPTARDDQGITLVDANNQAVHIPLSEVELLRESSVSLMPPDLYRQLSPQQLRDLFAYLQLENP